MKKFVYKMVLWIHFWRFHKKPKGAGRFVKCGCGNMRWVPAEDLNFIRKSLFDKN